MSDNLSAKHNVLMVKIDKIRTATLSTLPGNQNPYLANYASNNAVCQALLNDLTLDEFKTIYQSASSEERIGHILKGSWNGRNLIKYLFEKYPSTASDILKNSPLIWLKLYLLNAGFYPGLDYLDNLVNSSNIEIKLYAARRCSYALLEQLKKDPDYRVRSVAFKRLGFNQCLDEMLSDKAYQIRIEGAIAAPMYYHKFDEMTNDLSGKVFYYVAKKIRSKQIPYLLGNKHATNKRIKEILAQRLTETPIEVTME